jgi:hypothetical protein
MVVASDVSDAPVAYATLLAENGVRHELIDPTMGSVRGSEADGIHLLLADADDITCVTDDKVGVAFGSTRFGQFGGSATVNVATVPSGAAGCLDRLQWGRSWGGPGHRGDPSLRSG